MLVKHITPSRFDIFYGSGWDYWARFQLSNNKLHQIKGAPVPKNITMFLTKRYSK